MRINTQRVGIGALLLLLAGLAYFQLSQEAPPPPVEKAEPDLFAFVRSMEGTRPDGNLTVAPGDQLVVDAELGHLFDYYLAGIGEKPLAAIRAQIELELDKRLAPAPAREAKRLLGAYLAYKQALVGAEQALPKSNDMAQAASARLQAMRQLRAAYFTPQESAGLFGASDAYDDDAVARMAILGDTRLSEARQGEQLAALEARMPPGLKAERDAPLKVVKLEDAVQALRAQGAGDNEVYRLRAATFTPEAAARLADLDREESQWQQRIALYQAEKARLAQDADTLQKLRETSFTPDEQRRLGAYE